MILEFEISGQILKRIDSQELISKSSNRYKCCFVFEEESEWADVNKFAMFTDGWGNSAIVHLGTASGSLSCIVPNKVLQGSYFKVSLYGGDFLTTNNVTIALIQSGYLPITHHHHHHNNSDCDDGDEKDVFVEIFERLNNSVDSIVCEDNNLLLFCKDNILETVYLPFLTEADIRPLIDVIVEEYINKASLVSEDNDGFMSSTDKLKLDNIEECATRNIVDMELDINSLNPISNSTVTTALNGKEDSFDFIERVDSLIVDLINNRQS